MRCMICDKELSMFDGKFNTDTGKMGDTCGECNSIVHETLVEMSDGDEDGLTRFEPNIDAILDVAKAALDETPMFTDDPELKGEGQ